jgi:uncharacterized membrane protein YkoI
MFLVMGGLLIGSVFAGAVLTNRTQRVSAAPAVQTGPGLAIEDGTNDGETADDGQAIEDGTNDGAVAPAGSISTEQAGAAALAANPGTTVKSIEVDNEDGGSAFEVLLDNGLEIKIDALSGQILATEQD